MHETKNGAPAAPVCPSPVRPKPAKPPQMTLGRIMEDAGGIVKAWENACPASRDLFLKLINAKSEGEKQ